MSEKTAEIEEAPQPRRLAITKFSLYCLCIALLACSAAVMAGFGSRSGWWNFRIGFVILKIAGYGSLIAAGLSLIGCIWAGLAGSRFAFALALIGLAVALAVAGTLWTWKERAQRVPMIHDITTDTETPPLFKAILLLRKYAPNPAEYGGAQIAAMQRTGYPDLAPLLLPANAGEAFQKALSAAIEMGWEIVDANQADGRIEATDTTFWFGFKDDIVVRILPDKAGSRIDVRSVSRVGLSDVGTNAKRIRSFLKRLEK